MTTPINLTQLRAEAERFAALHHYNPNIPETIPPLTTLSVDELLALIDTAEAAIVAIAEVESGPYYYKRVDELRETLNHYTTTP
jgi:hypothetical protein